MVARDHSIPASRSLAGARAAGYHARLAGMSRYANPYADRVELRKTEGRSLGWLGSYLSAWWEGWNVADGDVQPS